MTFAVKEAAVQFGPTVQLSDLTANKRIREKLYNYCVESIKFICTITAPAYENACAFLKKY